MVLLNRSFFHLSMADNVIAFRCSSVIYTAHNLLLSPPHFQNSLSTFSIERVNGIPLWDFYPSDFQRALKIIIIAELFIVTTISPGWVRHTVITVTMPKNAHSRSYVLKGGGRLDLCDIPLLTICKLYKHVICEINNESMYH